MSSWCHISTILPFTSREMSIAVILIDLPVGGVPIRVPLYIPVAVHLSVTMASMSKFIMSLGDEAYRFLKLEANRRYITVQEL